MSLRSYVASLGLIGVLAVACSASRPPSTTTTPAPATDTKRQLSLLFFADAHVDLETHPELFWTADGRTETVMTGGYARLATAAHRVRDEMRGRAILIDGGDTFQGALPATASRGEVVLEPQRALGVELAIPGNWEVVYGAERMKELAKKSGYPWLATNVVDAKTGELVFAPTLVREIGGVRVGFVGFTDPDVPLRQAPAYSAGLKYLGAESIAPHVKELRERDHAELVVLITHVGLARSVALAESQKGIDVVLSADTHERVREPIVRNGVPVVEPGSFASFLGRLDVTLTPGARPTFDWKLLELRADQYPEDPAVASVVTRALAPYRDQMDKVIGKAGAQLERYGVVTNTFDDVLAAVVKDQGGTDIGISNGFRFGHPIVPGPISDGDLGRFMPIYGNIKIGKVTGAQLRAWMEAELDHVFADDPKRLFGGWVVRTAGLSVRFRANAPAGKRVVSFKIGDLPLDDAKTYSIASCQREGEAMDTICRIKNVREARVLDIEMHDAMRAYFARHGVVGGEPAQTIVAEDLPPRVFSQYFRR